MFDEMEKGKLIFGPSGRGKSVIGDTLEQLLNNGYDSLSDEQKAMLDDIKLAFPMYRSYIEKIDKDNDRSIK